MRSPSSPVALLALAALLASASFVSAGDPTDKLAGVHGTIEKRD